MTRFLSLKPLVLAAAMAGLLAANANTPAFAADIDIIENTETALTASGSLRLDIKSQCRDGNTIFTVRNAGNAWPKTSTFAIYRIQAGKGHMISKRRMRLAENQKASFKVKAASNPTGKLGIAVFPGWYERKPQLDATVICR